MKINFNLSFFLGFPVFDSWTKFQSGISFGNAVDFGNFEQCLDFKHDSDDSEIGSIQGQHCMVFYQATSNASTKTGDGNLFDWTEMLVLSEIDALRPAYPVFN